MFTQKPERIKFHAFISRLVSWFVAALHPHETIHCLSSSSCLDQAKGGCIGAQMPVSPTPLPLLTKTSQDGFYMSMMLLSRPQLQSAFTQRSWPLDHKRKQAYEVFSVHTNSILMATKSPADCTIGHVARAMRAPSLTLRRPLEGGHKDANMIFRLSSNELRLELPQKCRNSPPGVSHLLPTRIILHTIS